MKKILFFASVIAALSSCTSSEYLGDVEPLAQEVNDGSIRFSTGTKGMTRANKEGAEAADLLGNQFIVWGEKNESDGSQAGAGNLVFKNYVVNWADNSAFTTTSNTKNWEYVGFKYDELASNTTDYSGNVSPLITDATTTAQTIKYWDYSATGYTFTAVSAQKSDITGGKVKITKIESGADVYKKGYTLTLDADADKSKIFVSDRLPIEPTAGTDRTAKNTYGGNVTLNFRNVLSQVRVGMYETISGYKVTLKKFYYSDYPTPGFDDMTAPKTANFVANALNVGTSTETTLTVTYSSDPAILNHPTIGVSGTVANYLELGTGLKESVDLATTVLSPTYDQAGGDYTSVFPQETNNQNLKLKLDYTLTSLDTQEIIEVVGATAEVPYQYLQWKPNYKYTYIFKISENTNGSTGQGVVGLYPITFDAAVVVAEDGLAEYITTVSEPSITTFGVKGGVYYTTGEAGDHGTATPGYDYPAGTAVYAVVEDGSGLATLSASNFKIYEVSSSDDDTNFPVTEASVAEALIEGQTWTAAQAANKKITCVDGPALTYQNTVPAEDGSTITLDASNNKAATFTTVATKKYALVYQKTAATYSTDGGKKYDSSAEFEAAGTLYQDAGCTTPATSTYYSGHTDETYYRRTAVTNKGVYSVKIVTVE